MESPYRYPIIILATLIATVLSFHTTRPYSISRIKQKFSSDSFPLHGIVSKRLGDELSREEVANEDFEDPTHFENKPEWLSLFPKDRTKAELIRDYPDYANLPPEDPLFLDMPFPTEAGPEASAFGRHMQWKRRLSDGERLRWQKWAVYQRLMKKNTFQYSLEDYIFQNMLRDMKIKADAAKETGDKVDEVLWTAIVQGFNDDLKMEVSAVMKALYSAFNRKNFDELRTLWLPDENVELTVPGFDKVRGPNKVNELYRQIVKDSRPFGSVEAQTVSVDSNGFLAVVNTVEIIKPGTEMRKVKKNAPPQKPTKPAPPKRVLATTVLRKYNQQWRVMIHHAVRFTSSAFTGEAQTMENLTAARLRKLANSATVKEERGGVRISDKESVLSKEMARLGLPPLLPGELQGLLGDGLSLSTTSKVNRDGAWEKVITVDNDLKSRIERQQAGSKLNPTTAAAILSELAGTTKGNRLRLGSDGNLYVDREDESSSTSTSTTKDGKNKASSSSGGDSVGSFGKLLSGSTSTSSSSSSRAKNSQGIDESASVTKQTVQALRFLFKAGLLSREDKELLLLDIIDNIVGDDQTSLVVVAFELLVLKSRDSRKNVSPWSEALVGDNGMEEFADQCKMLMKSIRGDREADRQLMSARRSIMMGRRRGKDMSDEEDEEEEEEDEEDVEDDEEDDE